MGDRICELPIRFWVKHLSLDSWSLLISNLSNEDSDFGKVKNVTFLGVSDFLKAADCKLEHIILFLLSSSITAKVVQFHLSDQPFQNIVLSMLSLQLTFKNLLLFFKKTMESWQLMPLSHTTLQLTLDVIL